MILFGTNEYSYVCMMSHEIQTHTCTYEAAVFYELCALVVYVCMHCYRPCVYYFCLSIHMITMCFVCLSQTHEGDHITHTYRHLARTT